MNNKVEASIFRRGSTTYYFSSRFFPEPVRTHVFQLYSFVRVADNYVDELPAQPEKLLALEERWRAAEATPRFDTVVTPDDDVDTRVIKNLMNVSGRYGFEPDWIEAFFAAMKADIHPIPFATITDTLGYVYGSAEVIGLMMAKVMGLPTEALPAEALQGRAMQ